MRTRVLLIIKIYYLTFILVTAFSTLFHNNITDVILYLIIFSDSFLAICYTTLSYIYIQYKRHLIDILNSFNIISEQKFIPITLSNIFHPPKYLSFK